MNLNTPEPKFYFKCERCTRLYYGSEDVAQFRSCNPFVLPGNGTTWDKENDLLRIEVDKSVISYFIICTKCQ